MPGGSCGLFPSLVKQREERDAENRSMNRYIREALGTPEILAQLAEEAAELSQAALKYRRALLGTNPTPVSREEALRDLQGEIADVDLCIVMCDLPEYDELALMEGKRERWVARLKEKEGKP